MEKDKKIIQSMPIEDLSIIKQGQITEQDKSALSEEGQKLFNDLSPFKQKQLIEKFRPEQPFKTPSLVSEKTPKENLFQGDVNFSTLFKAGVPEKRQDILSILSKEIGKDVYYNPGKNTYMYRDESGAGYQVVPEFTANPLKNLAFKAADIAEAVPSIATGIATAPLMLTPGGTPLSMQAVGGTSFISDALRQKATNALLGRDQVVDARQSGKQALTDAGFQGAGKLVSKILERNVARDIDRLNQQDVDRLQSLAQRFGIDLTPAELTNLPSLKSQQKILGNVTGSADDLSKFYEKRQTQNLDAIDRELAKLSSSGDPYSATVRAQQAIKKARDAKVEDRIKATNPIYEDAFRNAQPVQVGGVVTQIDKLLKKIPENSKQAAVLKKIKGLMFVTKKGKDAEGKEIVEQVLDTNLGRLQRAKFEIDALKTEPSNVSIMNVINADVKRIEDELLSAMGKNNPKYIEANKKFSELSEALNEFDAKFAGVERVSDQNITNLMNKLIGAREPAQIQTAKNYIQKSDPTAWKQLKRAWISSLLEKVEDSAAEESVDLGRRFASKTFNKPGMRKRLQAALEPDEFQAFSDLAEVLTASGRVKKIGSDTAYNIEQMGELKRTPVGDVLRTDVTAPLRKLGDFIDQVRLEDNAVNIAKVITSPDGIKRIRELKRLQPSDARFIAGASQLFSAFLN
tara:strand:- start:2216 stop:4273 length:2058 start_codon:yes stop_codon:yes gene_type:complete